MTVQNPPLILHQYALSPFSEKIRVVFGIKELAWHACDQPAIMPKPELVALTGGYRRIPVLQIGADLYFDTVLIIDELERRYKWPSVYAGSGAGVSHALAGWTDHTVFWQVVTALFGGDIPPNEAFAADRSALLGRPFDVDVMKAAAPAALRLLAGYFDLMERQLEDGRNFLFGMQPDAADASLYHNIAFLRWGGGHAATVLNDLPRLLAWEARVNEIGHGRRLADVSRDHAIDIARAHEPLPVEAHSVRDDLQPGDSLTITYNDANTPPLRATLLSRQPSMLDRKTSRPRRWQYRYSHALYGRPRDNAGIARTSRAKWFASLRHARGRVPLAFSPQRRYITPSPTFSADFRGVAFTGRLFGIGPRRTPNPDGPRRPDRRRHQPHTGLDGL